MISHDKCPVSNGSVGLGQAGLTSAAGKAPHSGTQAVVESSLSAWDLFFSLYRLQRLSRNMGTSYSPCWELAHGHFLSCSVSRSGHMAKSKADAAGVCIGKTQHEQEDKERL